MTMMQHSRNGGVCALVLASVALAATGAVHAARIPPQRLVEVVDLSAPTISPDGRLVAFRAEQASVDRNTYDSAWYVQPMDGSTQPRRVGDGGVPLRDSAGGSFAPSVAWAPDGSAIYYKALIDGRVDVWRAAADGSGAAPITLDPADVRQFSLSEDGTTLKYAVGATRDELRRAEQREYDDGIRIDETVPVGAGLFRSSLFTGRLATQRYTGRGFERVGLLDEVPDHWREIDLRTGARHEPLPPAPPPPDPRTVDATFLPPTTFEADEPHGGRKALITRADGGDRSKRSYRSELSVLVPGSDAPLRCRATACMGKSISTVQWMPDASEVLFTVIDREGDESQSIFRWNLGTGAVAHVVAAHGLINGGRLLNSTCGLSPAALACVTAEALRPPRIEVVDIATGRRHVLYDPNAALAHDLDAAISARVIRWKDKNGQAFTGHLFGGRAGGGPRALFINFYECSGFLRGGYGDEWPLASLAETGISALCITTPALAGVPERYDRALTAVQSVVDLLAGQGLVDRKRVGMGGLSFGSEVTMWVAMHSDLLAAASVTAPSVTPMYYRMNIAKGDMFTNAVRTVWGLGSPEETPERWKQLSPVYMLDRIRAPVLFQMPEEEYLYGLDYILPLVRAHRAELYAFPNEGHHKFQPRHMLAAYQRNLDWYRFWLQGIENPDAGKAAQYTRWRAMRLRASDSAERSHQSLAQKD
jgi:hypothetical protein